MKITDPDVIKNGEKDLIEAVTDDLDLNAVKDILKKRMAAAALSSKGGEIIVYNNEIAFRLDFDIQLSGSLIFDRQGNYIPESDKTGDEETNEPDDQENLISGDFDLEDIDINETLEEVGPQTLLDDTEDAEIEDSDTGVEKEQSTGETIEENLEINLPDYDFDDELDQESGDHDESEDGNIETQHISETEDNENTTDDLITDDIVDDDIVDDDIVDDDISDIIEESREFWEIKKDS